MLLGILILDVMGITLNIVVLFGLILALGMLVDNAIVAVENIYRYKQQGYSNLDAAKFGVGEIAIPIIASTATTLAAFIPLGFWPGIMGEFMKYFPITLIIVLTSSLFVALVINPVIALKYMKIDEEITDGAELKIKRKKLLRLIGAFAAIALLAYLAGVLWLGNLMVISAIISILNFFVLRPASFSFQRNFLPWLENFYDNFVRFSLNHPFITVGINFVFLIISILLFAIVKPKVDFFPNADPLYVNAFIELPMGSDIEATNKIVKDIETRIEKKLEGKRHIVEAVLTQIGENTSDPNSPPEPGVTPNKARISVSFKAFRDREGISTRDIMAELREEVRDYPGVEIVIDKNADGPPAGKPVNLEIRGENIDTLLTLSEDIKNYLNDLNVAGIEELKSDIKLGKPELVINIDREAARRYELSTYSIANTIRTAIFGAEVSKYKEGEDEYPIMVRLDETSRNDISTLMNQKITFRNPANGRLVQVPISAVADIEYTSTYNSIKRKNSQRVLTVNSNVLTGYNANEIVAKLEDGMTRYDLPEGFTYEFTGQQQQQAEDMGFLSKAFLIAVFLIFLILVSQFNSLSIPFIIIASVGFSLIGVFLGYSLTGMTISVIFSGVGIISLAGVVVNNAIVLLDFIQVETKHTAEVKMLHHEDQLSSSEVLEIIVRAGGTRLRPVLLTAITTVLGLIPLAIGFNIDFFSFVATWDPKFFIGGDNTAIWGPMAWTVIYGLTFATFLTLVVVPVMYWLIYRLKMRLKYGKNRTMEIGKIGLE
jgi:multidrug efflux pump